MTEATRPGQIITFYSYKGGTGRTMALANIACLLARQNPGGKGVLMVDWDLEAPGLHRFFREYLRKNFGTGQDVDVTLDGHPGLIDLLERLNEATTRPEPPARYFTEDQAAQTVAELPLQDFILPTGIASLYLLKAGRFNQSYANRVNSFDWAALHDRSPWLFRALGARLASEYEYVLIDSRTGHTDIGGICTRLLPDRLALVFTPNQQSLAGVIDAAGQTIDYRRSTDDFRRLFVLPLPSRVEAAKADLLDDWRFGNRDQGIEGYQRAFERLFARKHEIEDCDLTEYFDEVKIQHVPDYSFGERIPVLEETRADRLSLTRSYQSFLMRLLSEADPWEETAEERKREAARKLADEAEQTYLRLPEAQKPVAAAVFRRLVSIDAGRISARAAQVTELDSSAGPISFQFEQVRVVRLRVDRATGAQTIELADEGLLAYWERCQQWVNEDQDFLVWRQGLQGRRSAWEQSRRAVYGLLRGSDLETASGWHKKRPTEVSRAESEYIELSAAYEAKERLRSRLVLGAFALMAVISLLIVYVVYMTPREAEKLLTSFSIWPSRFLDAWEDTFPFPQGGAARPRMDRWEFKEREWTLVTGDGGLGDGALLVGGASIGSARIAGALYDFIAHFNVKFEQGNSAAWVFRLQADPSKGYFFELERRAEQRGAKVFLHGYRQRPAGAVGDRTGKLEGSGQEVLIFDCCRPDDRFRIRAEVDGYVFRYWIAQESPDPLDDRAGLGREYYLQPMRDPETSFRFGAVGFFQIHPRDQAWVDHLKILGQR